jgi:hypothetical protein
MHNRIARCALGDVRLCPVGLHPNPPPDMATDCRRRGIRIGSKRLKTIGRCRPGIRGPGVVSLMMRPCILG